MNSTLIWCLRSLKSHYHPPKLKIITIYISLSSLITTTHLSTKITKITRSIRPALFLMTEGRNLNAERWRKAQMEYTIQQRISQIWYVSPVLSYIHLSKCTIHRHRLIHPHSADLPLLKSNHFCPRAHTSQRSRTKTSLPLSTVPTNASILVPWGWYGRRFCVASRNAWPLSQLKRSGRELINAFK